MDRCRAAVAVHGCWGWSYCYYDSRHELDHKDAHIGFDVVAVRYIQANQAVNLRHTCRKLLLWLCVVGVDRERLAVEDANAATGTCTRDKQRETEDAESVCRADPSMSRAAMGCVLEDLCSTFSQTL